MRERSERGEGVYMKKSLSFLSTEVSIGIAQNESNGGEEVTLAGTITADDDIVFWGEWFDDSLVLIAEVDIRLVQFNRDNPI